MLEVNEGMSWAMRNGNGKSPIFSFHALIHLLSAVLSNG